MAAKKKWENPGRRSEYDGLYKSWVDMHKRVRTRKAYSDVTICARWESYDNFFDDMSETWFKGATIDKDIIKPGNRVYCPEYCQWVTASENSKDMYARHPEIIDRLRDPEVIKKYSGENNYKAKKVKCVETGEIFGSTADADKKYNLKKWSVQHAANPKSSQKTAGKLPDGTKLHWEYVEE